MTLFQALVTLLFGVIWLAALAGHIVLLKILMTPNEQIKLGLPAGSRFPLLSITVADLAALLLGLPFTALLEIYKEWYFGALFCHLTPFVKMASITISAYGILALLMQCHELACKSHRPKASLLKQNLLMGVNWLLAFASAFPLLIAPRVRLHKGVAYEDLAMLMYEGVLNDAQTNELKSNETLVERAVCYLPREFKILFPYCKWNEVYVQYGIPLVLLIYLFIKTADSINRKAVNAKVQGNITEAGEQLTQHQQQTHQQQPKISDENIKFVRMILILAVAFQLLRSPIIIFDFVVPPAEIFYIAWYTCTILAESTYFIKPFLLLAVNPNFQNALRTIGVPPTDVEDTIGHHVNFSKLENEPTP